MKVYIPTMEELEQLQSLGVNVYSYLITKVTEAIIMEDIIYDENDMFEILENINEHSEIIYAVCRMYPKKIRESIITSKDPELCCKLISNIEKGSNIIYKLDSILMNFDESILFDENVIKNTIIFLSRHISSCPKYRFDYQGPNNLLDSIFSCEIPIQKISSNCHDELMIIDPIYAVKLGTKQIKSKQQYSSIQRGLAIYTGRYGIEGYNGLQYQDKDIINKPDENVKKLIRCLNEHREKYKEL